MMLNSPFPTNGAYRRYINLSSVFILLAALIVITLMPLATRPLPSITSRTSQTQTAPRSLSSPLSLPELVDQREAFARHYDMGNGRFLALVSPTPLNYRDAAGEWQPIQAQFQPVEGGWTMRENSLKTTLSTNSTAVQLESGGVLFLWRSQTLNARRQNDQVVELAAVLPSEQIAPGNLIANTCTEQCRSGRSLRYENAWNNPNLTEQFHAGPGALKQELILAQPPQAVANAEWLELSASFTAPPNIQIYADGQLQTADFTTRSAIELRAPDGRTLLQFAPPIAYEQADWGTRVNGRYHLIRQENNIQLRVQTPWSWWTDPGRQYPAVFDPTMQVIQALEGATVRAKAINIPPPVPLPIASVFQSTCVGHFAKPDQNLLGYDRGYIRFPLPTLPEGAQPDTATLVGVPDNTQGVDPGYSFYPDRTTLQPTYIYKVTEDWSHLLTTDTQPYGTYPAMAASDDDLENIKKTDPGLGLTDFPATTWDVTATVQDWYADPSTNYGFALKLLFEGFYSFETILPNGRHPTFNCFPQSANWSSLDDVVNNPGDPTVDGAGLGLLISYTAPGIGFEEFRTYTVPSANPQGSYLYQYQEYQLPVPPSHWRLIAAQGAYTSTGYANTPLDLADNSGDILISSDAGSAQPGNETYDWQPNYIAVNGDQSLPGQLNIRIQPDNQPTATHNEKGYYLQTDIPASAPVLPGFGISTTVPLILFRDMIYGQELDFAEDTTVEIKISYADAGLNQDSARRFNLQLFAPGFQYGSRTVNGAELTRGPDAYEIEFSVPPGQAGRWLLVLNSNRERAIVNMNAQITACQNNDDVVRYPLDGVCVELRRPPATLPTGATYQELGNLRLYSPAGFSNNCNVSCTTNAEDNGTPVMPLIGYAGGDDYWVALKGGTFVLDRTTNLIYTSADARLVMADFSSPTTIVSLPVLRGEFEAQENGRLLYPVSAPNDTYLLVKNPLHEQDTAVGWDYEVNLETARMRAYGPITRQVAPTINYPATDFDFDAEWTITAVGGPSLQGAVSLTSVSNGTFNLGTLLVSPPNSGYGIEHNPQHASPFNPAALPSFLQIRMTGATLAQPDNTGGAKLPVQGVILQPGQSVKDPNGNNVVLECGTHCLDLRGDDDAMIASGPLINREYRMPDLIIQDSANTIMINTPGGVDIWSSDHPYANANANDMSFNYEAYGGSVRTYRGQCPGARDPFNPGNQGPPGPVTTVVVGTAGIVLPNAGADSGDLSGGPQIEAKFILCEGSLREMQFTFNTGDQTAIPLGNSGLFLNFIGGTVSLTPQQPNSDAFTTVVMEMRFRGMSPQAASSTIFNRGVVTIDSRGLFDVQVQTGVQVYSGVGVGVDGHFWVAWSPLDLGFKVEACVPYNGFDASNFPATLCDGNELLYGMLRMHLWQGQGWQNKYDWLPDDDALHTAARFEAQITIAAGLIVDWGPAIVPPDDLVLGGIKLAFGEFCTNNSCTAYEWGVMGAFVVLGYDVGAYYGFDSGISFFMGSADYVLIDEAGLLMTSMKRPYAGQLRTKVAAQQTTIAVGPNLPSAMFGLGWLDGSVSLTLYEPPPGNRVIDMNTVAVDVTVTTTPTVSGQQTIIVIDEPLPGDWVVDMGNTGSSSDFRFFYFANRPAPSLQLAALPLTSFDEPTIPISWTSNISPDGDARLGLYYEMLTNPLTNTQEVAGPIVERIPLTASGVYSWNVEALASGSYRVFARIDNQAAAIINECGADYAYDPDPTSANCNSMLDGRLMLSIDEIYAPGGVRIVDSIPPAPPTGIGSRPEGISSVVVRWLPNDELDLAGYIVLCQQGTLTRTVRVSSQIRAGSTLSETARVNGLDAVPATCSVQAYDSSFNLSAPSATTSSTPTGNIPLPPAAVVNVNVVQWQPGDITVSWQPSLQAYGYLLYYHVLLNDPISQTHVLNVAAPPPLTGGYRANEGASPLAVGNTTSFSLTGLRGGETYEVWIRPYDENGRTGEASQPIQVTIGESERVYLPIVTRN